MEYLVHGVYNDNYSLRENSTTDLTIRQTNHLDSIPLHSNIFMIHFSFLYPRFLSSLYDPSQFVVFFGTLAFGIACTHNGYFRFKFVNHGTFGKVMSEKAGPRR